MAWIELHQSLPTHRKLGKLKRLLKIKTPQAVGHLAMLWLWCIDNAPDGDLSGIDAEDIAEAAEWPKDAKTFLHAMTESKLIDEDMRIHDWDDYAGRLLEQRNEKRQKNRERQARYRARKAQEAQGDGCVSHADVTCDKSVSHADITPLPNPTVPNPTIPDPTGQDGIPPIPPASGGVGDDSEPDAQERRFEEFWAIYPKKQGKGAALKAWKRIKPDKALFERIMASVRENLAKNQQWQRDGGQYIPNPSTWLNQTRWEDTIGVDGMPVGQPQQMGGAQGGRIGGADDYREFQRSTGFRSTDRDPDADG